MDLRRYPFLNKNENEAYLYYIKLSIEVISIRQKSHHSPLPDCSAPICEEGQYRNQNIKYIIYFIFLGVALTYHIIQLCKICFQAQCLS